MSATSAVATGVAGKTTDRDYRNLMKRLMETFEEQGSVFNGIGLDIRPECEEDWGRDYAIALFDIEEPFDDERRYFDYDRFVDDFEDFVMEKLSEFRGKKFVRLHNDHRSREYARQTRETRPGTPLVNFHRVGGGWTLELEIYPHVDKSRRKGKK